MNMTFPQLVFDLEVFYSQLSKENKYAEKESKKLNKKYGRRYS